MSTLATLPLTTLTGAPTSLADYAGKVLLIVNVASNCGLTPQYADLEALYQRYKDQGFLVLGFPANDFAGQEPGTNEQIAEFCAKEYAVSFAMFAKIAVSGPSQHPLYRELTAALPAHVVFGPWREGLEEYSAVNGFPPPAPLPAVLWNFEKFLIGRDGKVLGRYAPDMPPNDPRIVTAIEAALAA
jgi:glutathione peroxidase